MQLENVPLIKRLVERTDYPVCINQERILLSRDLCRMHSFPLHPEIMSTGFRIRGHLDVPAVRKAVEEMVQRHVSLRACFVVNPRLSQDEHRMRLLAFARTGIVEPGTYRQRILQYNATPVGIVDLTDCELDTRQVRLREIFNEEVVREFENGVSPFLRAIVVKVAADEHIVFMFVEHLVSDKWSVAIIRKEFCLLYGHFRNDTPYPLQPIIFSYREFAAWQDEATRSGYFDNALSHWHRQWATFGGARIAYDDFAFGIREPKETALLFDSEELMLGGEALREIRTLSASLNITLYVYFLSVFAIVLHAYTAKSVLAIWSHFANRERSGTQDEVGFYVNSHLLGFDCRSDPSCRELLNACRKSVLLGISHADLPLPYLWKRLRCHPRHRDALVLLDFSLMSDYGTETSVPGDPEIEISEIDIPHPHSPRFSSLGMYLKCGRELHISLQYQTSRFPQSAIRQMLADFVKTATAVSRAPHKKISELLREPPRKDRRNGEMNEFIVLGSHLIPPVQQAS